VELRHTSPPGPGQVGEALCPDRIQWQASRVPPSRCRASSTSAAECLFVDGRVQTLLARIAARSGFAGVRRVDSGSMQRPPHRRGEGEGCMVGEHRHTGEAGPRTGRRCWDARAGGVDSWKGRDRTILDEDDEGSQSMSTTLAQ